ncbi:MAG: hypothetical protein KDA99_04775 [Planctomycetales bacterium]|nr:hypothetical protein [Planctomycetales bacterium]
MPAIRRDDDTLNSGYDSFLDIVANLVGILVILIMVLGVRTQDAWKSAPDPAASAPPTKAPGPSALTAEQLHALLPDVDTPRAHVATLLQDVATLDAHQQQLTQHIHATQQYIDETRQSLAASTRHQNELAAPRRDFQQERQQWEQQQQAVTGELRQLEDAIARLRRQAPPPTVLVHDATPIAHSVTDNETHFQLLHGRIAFIPMEDLVERLRNEFAEKARRLQNADHYADSIGPIEGFLMKYELARRERAVKTSQGTAISNSLDLDHFILVPTSESLGEPVAEALRPGSRFMDVLTGLSSENATVTIWTYPDSYREFRQVKDHLAERGFQTAARPLPAGHPIGGSPDGSRSAAQ